MAASLWCVLEPQQSQRSFVKSCNLFREHAVHPYSKVLADDYGEPGVVLVGPATWSHD